MREENNKSPKNNWSELFKKKWFFPAVYLAVAAMLLTGVIWYQNVGNQIPDAQDAKDVSTTPYDGDAEPVTEQKEQIQMPVADSSQAEIVTKFYNYEADEKSQKDGIILYNNRYYQSTGTGIGMADGESFDVVASLGGTVAEVKEDPLLGNIVVMEHGNDIATYYSSLGEVKVKEGDILSQGDALGTSGKSLFMKDSGNHVHFELRKEKQHVNPEEYFNKPVSELEKADIAKSSKADDKAEEKAGGKAEDKAEEKAEEKASDTSQVNSSEDTKKDEPEKEEKSEDEAKK